MKSRLLLDLAPYLAYPLAFLQLLKSIRWFWRRMRKEVAPITPKTRRESARYFSVLVSVFTIAFGLLVLLVVSHLQTLSPPWLFLACGVGALGLLGFLVEAFGLPAYEYTKGLEDRCQSLEDRLKSIELQLQAQGRFFEEHFPIQQKLDFMENVVDAEKRREYTS